MHHSSLVLLPAALMVAMFPLPVAGQQYPVKPVRLIVPYAPGGPVDTVGRITAQALGARWGQQVIVENRAGSGGAVGTNLVVKSPADGYTLLMGNSGPITAYPHLRKKLDYQFERDLAPASFLVKSSMVLVVHPSLPAKTVPELVRVAKQQSAGLNYASSGVGGVQHLGMVLFESLAGLKLTHVPYKGAAPAMVDLLSGQVDLMFHNVLGLVPHLQAGRLRALGVSTAKPSAMLPDVPPVARTYPGFDVASWMGIYAPAGIPKGIVDQITRDAAAAVNSAEAKRRLTDLGAEIVAGGPAELASYARTEYALLGKLIAKAGIPKE